MFMVLNRYSQQQRSIIGFDSFDGLPSPVKEDLDSPNPVAKQGALDSCEAIVRGNLRDAGYNKQDNIKLVKGWFSDTLPTYDGKIALLHLDADLYDSTKCALENLWEKVAVGGIVALDEYQKTEEWPGERKAVDEYFKDKNVEMHRDILCNRYYFIKLRM